jgi:hypothetical protein
VSGLAQFIRMLGFYYRNLIKIFLSRRIKLPVALFPGQTAKSYPPVFKNVLYPLSDEKTIQ